MRCEARNLFVAAAAGEDASQQLTFIKPLAVASSTSREEPVSIYRCSEHGLWRVEADGRIKPFRP